MAAAPVLVSIQEYLNTSYSPDCEYVDGLVVWRNVGQGEHSYTQLKVGRKLDEFCEGRNLIVLTEQRTRVAAGRVRIPDVSVVSGLERVTTVPPLLCVEIMSPEDRWTRIVGAIADYQEMGVPCVWLIDPIAKQAWIFEASGRPPAEVRDGKLISKELEVVIELDQVVPSQPLD